MLNFKKPERQLLKFANPTEKLLHSLSNKPTKLTLPLNMISLVHSFLLISQNIKAVYFLLSFLLFSSFPSFSSALTDAEVSSITRRQLLHFHEGDDLRDEKEYEVELNVTFPHIRLKVHTLHSKLGKR